MLERYKLAGVIGNPIFQSKSPIIHNYWLKQNGIKGFYVPLEVADEGDFENVIKTLPKMGFSGVSITIPYKNKAFELVDKCSDEAKLCKSVNTIVFNEDGSTYGDTTDGYGFRENILEDYPDFDFNKGKVVILGAGGASRSVIANLLKNNVKEIVLLNRTIDTAIELSLSMNKDVIKVEEWDKRSEVLKGANLLVNCTSLGMISKRELEIDLSLLPKYALVNDIVYNPIETNLLKQAKEKGLKTVTGIGMLIHQARPAFKRWFDVEPIVNQELKDMLTK